MTDSPKAGGLSCEEFARMQPPRRHARSALAPHRDALRELKTKGYTYAQLQHYLALNGVQTSVANIADYFKRTAVMGGEASNP